jgi:hypothetical protein
MQLQRTGRDYYVLSIKELTTIPDPVTGIWQASFDHGKHWHNGTPAGEDNLWAWLLAGPDFNAASVGMQDPPTIATITEKVRPLVRNLDDPVLSVQKAPQEITLWSR